MLDAPPALLVLDPAALAAANVCPQTGLATDYLNHFNEVAMLLDMLPDMPEMQEEVLAWRPRSYRAHFEATGFKDKALVIAAFEAADEAVRGRFVAACREIEKDLAAVQAALTAGAEPAEIAAPAAARLYALIAEADAVIHGRDAADDAQNAADALFGPDADPPGMG